MLILSKWSSSQRDQCNRSVDTSFLSLASHESEETSYQQFNTANGKQHCPSPSAIQGPGVRTQSAKSWCNKSKGTVLLSLTCKRPQGTPLQRGQQPIRGHNTLFLNQSGAWRHSVIEGVTWQVRGQEGYNLLSTTLSMVFSCYCLNLLFLMCNSQ